MIYKRSIYPEQNKTILRSRLNYTVLYKLNVSFLWLYNGWVYHWQRVRSDGYVNHMHTLQYCIGVMRSSPSYSFLQWVCLLLLHVVKCLPISVVFNVNVNRKFIMLFLFCCFHCTNSQRRPIVFILIRVRIYEQLVVKL